MGEVSKFAGDDSSIVLRCKKLGEFDTVKKVSMLIDVIPARA
jgi:hypothetical protein